MTRRMGKSFAQLLTSRAVLMAVGLAGAGGGRGWTFVIGAMDARLKGGAAEGGGGGRGEVRFPEALLVRTRDGDDSEAGSCCGSFGGLVAGGFAAAVCGCACGALGWTLEDEQVGGEG